MALIETPPGNNHSGRRRFSQRALWPATILFEVPALANNQAGNAGIELGSYPDWIVALTAIAATYLGLRQLRHLAEGQQAGVAAQQTAARHAEAAARHAEISKQQAELTAQYGRSAAQQAKATARHAQVAARQAELAATQQRIVAEHHKENVQIAEANLLLRIDETIEGPEMRPSRVALRTLFSSIDARWGHRTRSLSKSDYRCKIVSRYLDMLRHAAASAYAKDAQGRQRGEAAKARYDVLMLLPGYIETMGWLWRDGYISEERLLNLYDGIIVQVIGSTLNHIRGRQGSNAHYLEMAIALYERALVWRDPLPQVWRDITLPPKKLR
ncbi:MAG TPA: hypothetical protein VF547_02430 [Allosphingosinicella sp.]|jgi:hypothetical protein